MIVDQEGGDKTKGLRHFLSPDLTDRDRFAVQPGTGIVAPERQSTLAASLESTASDNTKNWELEKTKAEARDIKAELDDLEAE